MRQVLCAFVLLSAAVHAAVWGFASPAVATRSAGRFVGDYDPTDMYRVQTIEGWRVLVHPSLLDELKREGDEALTQLRVQLYQITRVVPAKAVEKLRQVPIWVEYREPHHPCMAYHPHAGWLREHGMNPDKARAVEIANAGNFVKWTIDQPWMVLHELAHAYHHRDLGGYENPEILAAYRKAIEAKCYDSVLRINGRRERAYAATNQQEYFAEATEAYFGTNDFYPFVRSELREHDPELTVLLARLWNAE